MKAMVLFSGGIDSTTCLGMAVEKYGPENVIALSIAYGQKHTKEIEASDKIVKYYNVEHIYLDLAKIFQYSDCSLLSHSDKETVSYTHLRAHETDSYLVCRLLLEKKKKNISEPTRQADKQD